MNVSRYCADPGKSRDRQTTCEEDSGIGGRNPRNGRRKFNRGIVWIFVAMALLLVGGTVFLVLPMINKTTQHSAMIRVPAGADLDQVEDSLSKYFGKEFARDTRRAFRIVLDKEQGVRHGAWMIESGMTPFKAARVLARGGQASIPVTLNNQRTPKDVARLVASKLEFSEEDFLAALSDKELLKEFDSDPEHVLCLFLKDTYEFYWTASPKDVIRTMRENYRKFWTPARRDKADSLRLSTRDMVVLASIVDAETEAASEKGTIGRLYINRLDEEMKLQSDPTVIYALGDFSVTRVGGDMLKNDSPYNTYIHGGLPPGPIRLTSAATIDAILTARPHDFLYMCADESLNGTHNFAVTYEEHMANAKRYRDAMDKMGYTLPASGTAPDGADQEND